MIQQASFSTSSVLTKALAWESCKTLLELYGGMIQTKQPGDSKCADIRWCIFL